MRLRHKKYIKAVGPKLTLRERLQRISRGFRITRIVFQKMTQEAGRIGKQGERIMASVGEILPRPTTKGETIIGGILGHPRPKRYLREVKKGE